ncbi:hypothetical protein B0H13DRAFT_2650406, partial [Mycena leptocephala]
MFKASRSKYYFVFSVDRALNVNCRQIRVRVRSSPNPTDNTDPVTPTTPEPPRPWPDIRPDTDTDPPIDDPDLRLIIINDTYSCAYSDTCANSCACSCSCACACFDTYSCSRSCSRPCSCSCPRPCKGNGNGKRKGKGKASSSFTVRRDVEPGPRPRPRPRARPGSTPINADADADAKGKGKTQTQTQTHSQNLNMDTTIYTHVAARRGGDSSSSLTAAGVERTRGQHEYRTEQSRGVVPFSTCYPPTTAAADVGWTWVQVRLSPVQAQDWSAKPRIEIEIESSGDGLPRRRVSVRFGYLGFFVRADLEDEENEIWISTRTRIRMSKVFVRLRWGYELSRASLSFETRSCRGWKLECQVKSCAWRTGTPSRKESQRK